MEEPALRSRELGYSPVLPFVGLGVSQLLAGAGDLSDLTEGHPHKLKQPNFKNSTEKETTLRPR